MTQLLSDIPHVLQNDPTSVRYFTRVTEWHNFFRYSTGVREWHNFFSIFHTCARMTQLLFNIPHVWHNDTTSLDIPHLWQNNTTFLNIPHVLQNDPTSVRYSTRVTEWHNFFSIFHTCARMTQFLFDIPHVSQIFDTCDRMTSLLQIFHTWTVLQNDETSSDIPCRVTNRYNFYNSQICVYLFSIFHVYKSNVSEVTKL